MSRYCTDSMKLHYFHGPGPIRALVLLKEDRRVELYIKKVGEDTWALVALSGGQHGQPDRSGCQGPYRSVTRAEAVLRHTVGSLLGTGHQPCREDPVIWSVFAQRLARTIRLESEASQGNYQLDPDQFEPIT